ncbi:MAG TPA: hypothetical protein IAB01_00860 [Candidatus Avidesulfovibrio excrementigallinarum]|nr:hypothetical protein [Candidatus Avidesulfovibrio excrementigallinarum]
MQDDKLSVSPIHAKGRRSRRYFSTLLLLVLLLVAAGGGYWWFDSLDKGNVTSAVRGSLSGTTELTATEEKEMTGGHAAPLDNTATLTGGTPSQNGEVTPGNLSSDVSQRMEEAPAQTAAAEADMQHAEAAAVQSQDGKEGSEEAVSPASAGAAESSDTSRTEMRFALDRQSPMPASFEGRQDDAVVSSRFTGDLARWMVQGYRPGNNGKGYLAMGIQAANIRYGTSLQGFNWSGDDLRSGRRDILKYVFTPGMINGLYRLYVDQFFQNLDAAAAARGLTDVQVQNMCDLYARQFKGLAGALDGLAATPDLSTRLASLTKLTHAVAEADRRYGMLAVERERAKTAGDTARARALKKDVGQAMRTYRQAVQAQERGTRELVRTVKRNTDARLLDDSTLLFVSSWIGRRFARHEDVQAVRAAAEVTADFARRLAERGHP